MQAPSAPIGILYEHPEWFRPLFAELDRRGLRYERVHAQALVFDPARRPSYGLVLNRMSPSAYLRGHGHAIFASLAFLDALERHGVPTVNGAAAFRLELSKAAQLALLARLDLPHPRSRVINHPSRALEAADDLVFPLMVKPNIGGSGAKIQRFETRAALEEAVAAGTLDLGIDETALVQEYHPPADGAIVRVEVLDGLLLYAIRIYPNPDEGFNLCPADICRDPAATGDARGVVASTTGAPSSDVDFCPVDLPRTSLKVEGYSPPQDVIDDVVNIARAAGIDVGGIEYLTSARDGRRYYYDINALSNFVSDAPAVVGFDPVPVFADYLQRRAAQAPAGAGRGARRAARG
ncbi:MAG: hypothetical protein QN174_11700 [Armatimonadota bacterium]|nr:hypothetical protein [Armatimonadota bacterium]MDR7422715.1 hypothetical protein [Armatimonadota bacterium]MDR7457429.1 hypothetical protein [Armatimonadota bacterium]MDR7497607.1 hypothetical protein [Armatimonadota bacterium]